MVPGGGKEPTVSVPPRLVERTYGIIIFDPTRDACQAPKPPKLQYGRDMP